MIYGISRNKKKGLGHSESYGKDKTLITKPKALYEQFVPSVTHVGSSEPTHSKGSRRQSQKRNKSSRTKSLAHIPLRYSAAQAPKVPRTSGKKKKSNKKGPRKCVPKNKIILLADILDSSCKTPVMAPGQWKLVTHKGRKAYIPKTGI